MLTKKKVYLGEEIVIDLVTVTIVFPNFVIKSHKLAILCYLYVHDPYRSMGHTVTKVQHELLVNKTCIILQSGDDV